MLQTLEVLNGQKEKGLYAEVFENIIQMDAAIQTLAYTLASSSPEAMINIKKAFGVAQKTGTSY